MADYQPAMLDELIATGEVLSSGAGALRGNDGWLSLHLAESAGLTLTPAPDFAPTDSSSGCWTALADGGGTSSAN